MCVIIDVGGIPYITRLSGGCYDEGGCAEKAESGKCRDFKHKVFIPAGHK